MKIIKRKSAVKPITGSIVDTTNIDDKTVNTYSANVIESLLGGTSWKNATLNSSYVSGGFIKYIKIGKLVIVEVSDLVIQTTTGQITVLGTGLPSSAGTSGLLHQFSSGTVKRVVLNGGEIKTWYDAITASSNAFFGLFVYFA